MTKVLNIPGLYNSGPGHWQTVWENKYSWINRVEMPDWDCPKRTEWIGALENAIETSSEKVFVIGHSLGCHTVAHLSSLSKQKILAAFLVAAPDLSNRDLPPEIPGFAPAASEILPFPTIFVASTTDPYCPIEISEQMAKQWGATLVNIGAKGHINADTVGAWQEGEQMFLNLYETKSRKT